MCAKPNRLRSEELGTWEILLSGYPGIWARKGKSIPDLDVVASTAQERLLRNLHPTAVALGTINGSQGVHVSEMCQSGCSGLSLKRLIGDSEGSFCIVPSLSQEYFNSDYKGIRQSRERLGLPLKCPRWALRLWYRAQRSLAGTGESPPDMAGFRHVPVCSGVLDEAA